MRIPAKRSHWYAFSFSGKNKSSRSQCYASVYVGYPERALITLALIAGAKTAAGVEEDSVLLACSYLGEMTKEEFEAGVDRSEPKTLHER